MAESASGARLVWGDDCQMRRDHTRPPGVAQIIILIFSAGLLVNGASPRYNTRDSEIPKLKLKLVLRSEIILN